jgi:hypothetical protein
MWKVEAGPEFTPQINVAQPSIPFIVPWAKKSVGLDNGDQATHFTANSIL